MPIVSYLIALLLLVTSAALPVFAQNNKSWTFRGTTVWDHPDGRQIQAGVADARLKDDSMTIVRDRRDGRWYLVFTYRRSARFGTGRTYFFMDAEPPAKESPAKRILSPIGTPRIFQERGRQTKYIVAQLSKTDRDLLRRYSGHHIGVAYSLTSSSGASSSKFYRFYGNGLKAVLDRLERVSTLGGSVAVPSDRSPARSRSSGLVGKFKSAAELRRLRSVGLMNVMNAYRLPPIICKRPIFFVDGTRQGLVDLATRFDRYINCRREGLKTQVASLRRFVRSDLGGTVTGRSYRIRCNKACLGVFRQFMMKHSTRIEQTQRGIAADFKSLKQRLRRAKRKL